jgi:hypothetical protein
MRSTVRVQFDQNTRVWQNTWEDSSEGEDIIKMDINTLLKMSTDIMLTLMESRDSSRYSHYATTN